MLDKLSLTSPETITLEEATNNLKGSFSHYKLSGSKYHQTVCSFHLGHGKKGIHLLTLHIQPRHMNIAPVKIEINPSKFQSLLAMVNLISRLIHTSNLRITRIDHTVDIELPIQEIHNSLIFSRKKSREQFKEAKLTGFTLGDSPEKLVVYDKARKDRLDGMLTRIELRHFGTKVKFKEFENITSYETFNPFLALKFKSLVNSPPQSLKEQSKRALIVELMAVGGAQGMFKTLNRHSNFKRDFQPCFEDHPGIPNLNQIYQNNLRQFFGGQTNG